MEPIATSPITVQYVATASLKPDQGNPRVMPPEEMEALVRSIQTFGLVDPIVVRRGDRLVIGGHQRLEAAKRIGMAEVPVVELELSDDAARALNLALNRIGGTWDVTKLAEILRTLPTDLVGLTGFDEDDLRRVAHEAELALLSLQENRVDPDEVPAPPKKATTKPGDLWALGRHRLVCGDSRDRNDVLRLCDGARPDVLWTDPPYGVEYVGGTRAALRIQNDGAEGLGGLLRRAFAAADVVLAPSARFYVAAPAGPNGTTFRSAIDVTGWRFHQALVWVKDALVLGHSDYHYRHEDILYGWTPGPGRPGRGQHRGTRWYGDNAQDSVLHVTRPKSSEEHPTMKPVELVRRCLANSSVRGQSILDLFGGSGSTLLAAEVFERRALLVEIDPRYCDVIVQRWERFTGKKAERLAA